MPATHAPEPKPNPYNNPTQAAGGGGRPHPARATSPTRNGCSVRSAGFRTFCGCN